MRFALALAALLPLASPSLAEEPAKNANMNVVMTFADGRKVEGHVVTIQRSQDWYAEQGWVDTPSKLVVTLEGNGTEIDRPWTDISAIDVKYGGKTDVDCMYESEFTPWMYTCALQTTATVKTTDGKYFTANDRHKWLFVFDDGRKEEFFLKKLPVRRQEEVTDARGGGQENHALYAALQAEVWQQAQKAVTRVEFKKP